MKKCKRIKNLLSDLLKNNMTQKEFAKKLKVTESTLSDFTNLKRSTININLLNDIVTCKDLNIKSITDILSIVETFSMDKYEEYKYYPAPVDKDCYFSFSNNPNSSYIEVLDVLNDGRVLITRHNILIENFIPETIHAEFKKSDFLEPLKNLDDEDMFVHEFVSVAKKDGIIKDMIKYSNKSEALQVVDMLYL